MGVRRAALTVCGIVGAADGFAGVTVCDSAAGCLHPNERTNINPMVRSFMVGIL